MLVALLAAGVWLLKAYTPHHHPAQWLVWRYSLYWALATLFVLSSLSAGHGVLSRLRQPSHDLWDHLVFSFTAGVVLFFLALFLLGVLGLYGPVTFFAVPALFLGVGGRSLYRHVHRRWVLWRKLSSPKASALSWQHVPVLAFGLLGIALVYFPILSPNNVSYDARWYHLPLAERYIAEGGVVRFAEGWLASAIPHLASFIYAWGFMTPGADVFDRVGIAAHLEFVIFLFTLAGIPLLVRHLAPGRRVPLSWAGLFLFPGVLIYDSNLNLGADHVAALFAIPIWLTTMRAWRDLRPATCVELALYISGALLTKYTAAILVVLPVLLIAGRALWLGARGVSPLGWWWRGPLACLAVGLVITSTHWLKNWVFYGDPLYPMLHRFLDAHPWNPDSEHFLKWFQSGSWVPKGTLGEKLLALSKVLVDFSYVPHNWASQHGKWPVFGSLFTVLLLTVPFLRSPRRLLLLVASVHVSLAAWFFMHHQDRYLQVLVPQMAAVVVVITAELWSRGWLTRAAVAGVVALQLIWATTIYFIPGHSMTRQSVYEPTAELLGSAYTKKRAQHLAPFRTMVKLGEALGPEDRVLLHYERLHFGLGRRAMLDRKPGVVGLSYGRAASVAGLWDYLRERGVTHLFHASNALTEANESVAGELLYWTLAQFHTREVLRIGGHALRELGARPPSSATAPKVAYFVCDGSYEHGLFALSDLTVPRAYRGADSVYPKPLRPVPAGDAQALQQAIGEADFVAFQPQCQADPGDALKHFTRVAKRNRSISLYARTPVPVEKLRTESSN